MRLDHYSIRPARTDELDTVMALLAARITWLRQRGSDQWLTFERWRPAMIKSLRNRDTWALFGPEQTMLATITTSRRADADFWTPAEQAHPALYLSKLATDPAAAGRQLGDLVLRWSLNQAARHGLTYVRFDAWRTAADLHTYYKEHGWNHLRTVEVPGRHSGALFERPTATIDIPNLVTLHNGS